MAETPITKDAHRRFNAQRGTSKVRGIPFLLTEAEWWKIWQESGHWPERGKGVGKYHMARFGDVGPYAVGNVKIITHSQNSQECSLGVKRPPRTKEHSRKISEALTGRKIGPMATEHKRKISEANKGRPKSLETRRRMSEAPRSGYTVSPAVLAHIEQLRKNSVGSAAHCSKAFN